MRITKNKLLSPVVGASYVLALGLTMSGCKSKQTTPDDASLTAAVQNRLQSDSGLANQQVQPLVQNGVVTLSGTVTNEAARSLAANDAAEISGVRTVVNNLVLSAQPVVATSVAPAPEPVRTIPDRELRNKKVETARKPDYQPAPQPAPAPITRSSTSTYQPQQPPSPPVRQSQPTFRNVSVPVGTGLSVRITQTLDSQDTQPGSTFSGVLANDVVIDGSVVFPAGTTVTGHVDDAKDAGHFSGNSLLAISLNGVRRHGETVAITTDTFSKEGKGRGKNTAEKIGGGAAIGAILGGIFGGGKGAAIGAGAGGGLGAGANGVTRGEQVQIPSESVVRFRLTSALSVRVSSQPDSDNGNGELRRRDQ